MQKKWLVFVALLLLLRPPLLVGIGLAAQRPKRSSVRRLKRKACRPISSFRKL